MPKRERPIRFPPPLRGGDDKVVPDSNVEAVQPVAEQHPIPVWRRVAFEVVYRVQNPILSLMPQFIDFFLSPAREIDIMY